MQSKRTLLALYLCFFFSGVAGLIYEVVWSRYLALFVGSTGAAHIIILSTFMGGLALGAFLFGKWSDRVRKPLMLYAGLEVGIGLFGLLYPSLFGPIRQFFIVLVKSLGLNPTSVFVAAMVASALTILIPTTLMGGTLPALSRYIIRSERSIGRHIARLYYLNSFGAVFGSLIAGFWLIQVAGLSLAMVCAAILNLGVAGLAYVLARIEKSAPLAESKPADTGAEIGGEKTVASTLSRPSPPPPPSRGWNAARIAIIVIAFSGFASMVYEVAWIRLLTLILGSAASSFALMLAAFIFGITLGSFLLSLKRSDHGYYRILGWAELGIGLTVLLSLLVYERLPVVMNQWRTSLVPSEHTYPLYHFIQFLFCFLVMVVPTIFMGATLPAASRVVASELGTLGRKIGTVYALNTVGTLLGAGAAGFFFLPAIGIKHTLEAAVALNIVLGLWVLWTDVPRPREWYRRPATALAAVVLIVGLYAIAAPGWDARVLTTGTYRIRDRIGSFRELKELSAQKEILYYKDGTDATIAIARMIRADGSPNLVLLINGKPDASSDRDMINQLLVGHLPLLMHPDPESILVVGLGSGVTAGAATLYGASNVECVELIPEVLDAARFYKDLNHNIVDRPDASVILQDAKTFLQVTPRTYDVIINEPTNPWIAGVASLFTREYYEVARNRLRPGGFFVQWLQCYEILDPTLYSMLYTFNEQFPYSTLFNVSSADLVLIGSTEPFAPDFRSMENRMRDPAIAADLKAFGIRGLLPLLSMQMVAKTDSPAPYMPGRINSDFFPVLETECVRGFFMGSRAEGLKRLDRRVHPRGQTGLWIEDYRPSDAPDESLYADYYAILRHVGSLHDRAAAAWCDRWARDYPESPAMRLGRAQVAPGNRLGVRDALAHASLKTNAEALMARAQVLTELYEGEISWAMLPDSTALREVLGNLEKMRSGNEEDIWVALGDLERDAGRNTEALGYYGRALPRIAGNMRSPTRDLDLLRIRMRIAECYLQLGRLREARTAIPDIPEIDYSDPLLVQLMILDCRIQQAEQRAPMSRR